MRGHELHTHFDGKRESGNVPRTDAMEMPAQASAQDHLNEIASGLESSMRHRDIYCQSVPTKFIGVDPVFTIRTDAVQNQNSDISSEKDAGKVFAERDGANFSDPKVEINKQDQRVPPDQVPRV